MSYRIRWMVLLLLAGLALFPSYVLGQEGISSRIYKMPGIVVTEYRRIEGLIYPDIQVVACFGDKILFGTNGAGLCVYDVTGDAWYVMDETRGLSDNTITAVAHVPGHLWIGTSSGLNHYDERGKKWAYYTLKDGLPSDHITALALVQSKVLYVGTDKGLAIYNMRDGTWRSLYEGQVIRCLTVDDVHEETVWVGTDKGMAAIAEHGVRVFGSETMIDERVRDIATAGDRVWIVHASGITLYDRRPVSPYHRPQRWHNFVQYKLTNDWAQAHWTNEQFRQLARDFVEEHTYSVEAAENRVWVGTTRGCVSGFVFTHNLVSWSEIAGHGLEGLYVKALARDEVGNLWIGTARGAFVLDAESRELRRLPQMMRLTSGQISDVLLYGNYAYAATFGGGLNIYDTQAYQWSSLTKMDGAGSDFLTAMAEHGGTLWLGSFGGGVTRYDPHTQVMRIYTRKQGLVSNTVHDIAVFDRKIWFATPVGLSAFDPENEIWYAFQHQKLVSVESQPPSRRDKHARDANVIALDRTDRRLWVLTADRIGFIEKTDTLAFHPFPLPQMGDPRPLSCVLDTYEALWIGQGAQIKRFDKKAEAWRVYGEDKGLGTGQVRSLAVCKGSLWAATYTGLYKHSALTDRWRLFDEKDGLRVKEVQALSAFGPVLLIGGRNGVSMYHVEEEWWRNFPFMDYAGPLRSDDVRDVAADSQYVWLATYGGGMARYDKEDRFWTLFTEADGLPSNVTVDLRLEGDTLKAEFDDRRIAQFDRRYGAWERAGAGASINTSSSEMLGMLVVELHNELGPDTLQAAMGALRLEQEWGILKSVFYDDCAARFNPRYGVWEQAGTADSITVLSSAELNRLARLPEELAGDDIYAVFLPVGVLREGHSLKPVFYDVRVARFDKLRGIWVKDAKSDNIIALFHDRLRTLARLPDELAWHDVQAVAEDTSYQWFATRNGVWRYHTTHQMWKHYAALPHLPTDQIETVVADDRNLWLGTAGEGVVRFNKALGRWEQLDVSGLDLAAVIVPDRFDLWVAAEGSMGLIPQERGTVRRFSPKQNFLGYEIKAVLPLPKQNAIWVATSEGVSVAPFEALGYLLERPHTAPGTSTREAYRDIKSRRKRFLSRSNRDKSTWERFWGYAETSRSINRIAGWIPGEDARKELETWFPMLDPWQNYTDLCEIHKHYRKPESEPVLVGRKATGLTLMEKGLGFDQMWMSTSGGLTQLTPIQEKWRRPEALDGVCIHKVAVDDRWMCFATSEGVYIYDRREEKWNHVTASDGLIDDFVLAIACVEDEVWIGTPSGVSVYYINDREVRNFTESEGMAMDFVQDMVIDGRFVWAVHPSNGLSRYDRTGQSWTVFRCADGVPHRDEGR